MRIAIIAWGSLVWDQRALRIDGSWNNQDPCLEIEFSRVSKDGRLTLVIDPDNGAEIETYHAKSVRSDLGDAIADLRDREGTIRKRIGFVEVGSGNNSISEFTDQADVSGTLIQWCKDSNYEAAVWTALPSQFQKQTDMEFSVENAITYLKSLPLSARNNALDYIKKAPREVITPVRQKIEKLGEIKQQA